MGLAERVVKWEKTESMFKWPQVDLDICDKRSASGFGLIGPVLFLIFINDLKATLTSSILKFADDTKLFGKVNNDKDRSFAVRSVPPVMV